VRTIDLKTALSIPAESEEAAHEIMRMIEDDCAVDVAPTRDRLPEDFQTLPGDGTPREEVSEPYGL